MIIKKTSDQCTVASTKANKMVGFIIRNIDLKSPEIMKKLYTAFMRPQTEIYRSLLVTKLHKRPKLTGKSAEKSE